MSEEIFIPPEVDFRNPHRSGIFTPFLLVLIILAVLLITFVPEVSLRPFGTFLVVNEAAEPSDAIIVLLGSDGPDRVLRAHELYTRHLAPRIVFGSGFVEKRSLKSAPPGFIWVPESARYQMALESLGIKREEMLIVDTSDRVDTAAELAAIADRARAMGWAKVILVTSATHSRRASIIWKRIAPEIYAFSMSAPETEITRWWRDSRLIRSVGYEYGAMIKEGIRQVTALLK